MKKLTIGDLATIETALDYYADLVDDDELTFGYGDNSEWKHIKKILKKIKRMYETKEI